MPVLWNDGILMILFRRLMPIFSQTRIWDVFDPLYTLLLYFEPL